MPPGHPPKRPKVDPSRSQEAIFSLLNFDLILGSIFIPFWLPKCLPLGTLLATKIIPKNSRSPQDRPKIAQDHPKMVPRSAKTTQEPPRPPQGAPKVPPRPPKTLPRPPKIASRPPKMLPRDPKIAPRNRNIALGWLRLHNERMITNKERIMNE